MKQALIAGATGLVGQHVVKELISSSNYDTIHIITRRKTPFNDHPLVKEHIIDFDKLEEYGALFQGVDDVFVTLGTTIKKAKSRKAFMKVDYTYPLKIAKLAKEQNVKRFLIVSSMGAERESRFFYSRVKGELEENLVTLNMTSLHIFRPSLLLGKREEVRIGEKLAEWIGRPLSILLVGPLEKYKPVYAARIAAVMLAVSEEDSTGVHIYESDQIRHLGKVLQS